MRHRKSGRKLNMDSAHRKAVFRNLVTSLVTHGRIRTTEAKAKELRGFAEKVITLARNAPTSTTIDGLSGEEQANAKALRVHAIRRAQRWIQTSDALDKLFDEVGPSFADRPGGYTRVIKADIRSGDNAPMAIIELVGLSERIVDGDDGAVADDVAPVAAAAAEE